MKDNWGEYELDIETTVLTFSYLHGAARALLQSNTKQGAMAASVFAAFVAEAYFNHVGSDRIPYWDDHLEALNIQAKAVLLNDVLLKKQVDWGKRPYQTLGEAIGYRNALAHGKTTTVKLKTTVAEAPDDLRAKTKWEKCLEPAVASRLLEDVEQLIAEMAAALGDEPPFPQRSTTRVDGKPKGGA